MYGIRARRPGYKSQPSMAPNAVHEEFKPDTEWIEEPSNRHLIVQLPGRISKCNSTVLGSCSSKAADKHPNKHFDVCQSFDVPKDTIMEKISGRFEDGRLTLTMPKRLVEEDEAKIKPISEEKVKEHVQDERAKSTISDEKGREPSSNEKPETAEGRKEEEPVQEGANTDQQKKDEPMHEEKPMSHEEKKEEHLHAEKPTSLQEMKDEPVRKEKSAPTEEKQKDQARIEKPTSSDQYKDEATQEEKPKTADEKKYDGHDLEEKIESDKKKKEDGPISQEEMERSEEKKDELAEKKSSGGVEEKKEDQIQTDKAVSAAKDGKDAIQKVTSKIKEICMDTPKEIRKRLSAWRGAEERWLDSGSLDDILEKMNKNRKVIAVAVVAFSVGFYVSHKLRTRI